VFKSQAPCLFLHRFFSQNWFLITIKEGHADFQADFEKGLGFDSSEVLPAQIPSGGSSIRIYNIVTSQPL
jgi:hypothetical protein